MIQEKINNLLEIDNQKQSLERQKIALLEEIKKYKFSSDENIINKWIELSAILDDTEMDLDKRLKKFFEGYDVLTSYLQKYDKVITVIESNAVEVAQKTLTNEVSFKLYPDIFNLKPVARNGFFICLAAPTGVGKTRWLLNLMYHKYKEKKVSYFFSFEMTEEEIVFNLLAIDLFYRSFDVDKKAYTLYLSKEEMEADYKSTSTQKREFYDSRIKEIFSFIRILSIDRNTPKNIFFGMTYKSHEHGEEPEFVCIDHFHLMESDNREIQGEVAVYKDIAFNLYKIAKQTKSVFVILGQMDNKEKESPKFYEESGWKWCGDFPTYVQHYWKLFRDQENGGQWLLYNAKMRNHTPVFEPYEIKYCPANGAIISVRNEALR